MSPRDGRVEGVKGFVLVGGWPGSGKTTLSRALASSLDVPYLSKDAVKESLMDALGAPSSVEESRVLGRAAVFAVLRAAQGCQGAVIDSTWYPYSESLVRALPGLRTEAELWGDEVAPLGVGPLVEVTTIRPVDAAQLATYLRASLSDSSSV